MAELTPDIVDQVVATCTKGSEEAAEALGRALDAEFSMAVGEPGTIDAKQMPEDLAGPGPGRSGATRFFDQLHCTMAIRGADHSPSGSPQIAWAFFGLNPDFPTPECEYMTKP